MVAKPKTHVSSQTEWRLHVARPIRSEDRPSIVVMSTGTVVHLLVMTAKGECLGTLEHEKTLELAADIIERRKKPSPTFSGWPKGDWDGLKLTRPGRKRY